MVELLRKQEGESAKWEGEAQALTAELQSLRLDLINRDALIRREEENSNELNQQLQQVSFQKKKHFFKTYDKVVTTYWRRKRP